MRNSVERLLLVGANPDTDSSGVGSKSLLCKAAGNDAVEVLSLLLAHGADPNRLGRGGWSPLCSAITRCGPRDEGLVLVETLLHAGALPDHPQKDGATPIVLAIGRCSAGAVQLLLREGVDREQRVECPTLDPNRPSLEEFAVRQEQWWLRYVDSEFEDERTEAAAMTRGARCILEMLEDREAEKR